MKILITGGTGLIGRHLGPVLADEGHELFILSRSAAKAREVCGFKCEIVEGDLLKGPVQGLKSVPFEAAVHLMGENVGEGRWTAEKKKAMVDSRVKTTRHLRASVHGLKALVAASATGFYGDRGEEELDEESSAGRGFLADLCGAWEREVETFRGDGARVVRLRTGMVVTRQGGALAEMLPAFRAGVGGPIAGGRAWMSWIHLDDIVGLYHRALDDGRWDGVYNAVSPRPVRNAEFTKTLGEVLHRPAIIPIPGFALKLAFGEKAEVLLASQKVHPRRVLEAGYEYKYSSLHEALSG